MSNRWFYSKGNDKAGPYSGQQLKDLAASGDILPTDTVWKEGNEKGALASRVEHLFAPVFEVFSVAALVAEPDALLPTETAQLIPLEPEAAVPAPAAKPASVWQRPARKATAFAGRGTIIVGQDGVTVRYKKKCPVCQHTEAFSHTMPIREGTTKTGFYCTKCRKNRQVEIKGSLS